MDMFIKFINLFYDLIREMSNRYLNKKNSLRSFFIRKKKFTIARISQNIRYWIFSHNKISKDIPNDKIPEKHCSREQRWIVEAINIIENENRSCSSIRGTKILRNEDSPLLPYPRQFCQFPWIRSRYAKLESLRKHWTAAYSRNAYQI